MANEELLEIIAQDVMGGLQDMFGPDPAQTRSVVVHPEFADEELPRNDRIAPLPWIYYCVHDGDFEGLAPTQRKLQIHGVTFVDNRNKERGTQYHRLVDWMGVVTQLGLQVSWRTPVDLQQYITARAPGTMPP
jgi:hypothetical protein